MAPRRGPGPRSHPRTLIQNAAGLGHRQPRTPCPGARRGPGAAGGDARRGRGLRRPPARRHAGEEPVQPGGRWLRLPRPAAQRGGLSARHPLPGQGEPRPLSPSPGRRRPRVGKARQGQTPTPPRASSPFPAPGGWGSGFPPHVPPQRWALACCRPTPVGHVLAIGPLAPGLAVPPQPCPGGVSGSTPAYAPCARSEENTDQWWKPCI